MSKRKPTYEELEIRLVEVEEALSLQSAITANMAEGVCLIRARDGTIVYANPTFEKMFGYNPGEITGKHVSVINASAEKSPEDNVKEIDKIDRWHGEVNNVKKDGSPFWCSASISMFEHPLYGRVQVAIHTDVTERKRMAEDLKSAHEYARNLIDSSLDMIISVDKERRIVEFNQAAQTTFGYDKAEVLGKHIDILYANPAEGLKTHNITRTTGRFSEEIVNKRKNGETFPTFLSASILRDACGEYLGVMGVSRDITKVKQSEKEKEDLQAQLLQSQKMEAIGELASGIAHDFNNLLTIISGYSQFLLGDLDKDSPIRNSIEQIYRAGERAALLTKQLLIFSRKQILKPKVLDLNVVVSYVEKMLGRLIGEDIKLITILESKLYKVKADRGQIEQVLINLVVNARDAMPEGGRVIIRTQDITFDKDICKTIPESIPGIFVCVTVEDTGFGMRKEILSHIFEPFFSTKKPGEGTGLGLSVVYGIVKQHRGWINVYSESGRGATFKFYLPAILAESEEEIKEDVSIETLRGNGERILLVEDDEDVRQFAVTVLREYGYIVFDAASVKEAQRVFEDEEYNFDLVFSDVILPDKTGLQLVDDILLQKPDIRVLLSSGYSDHKSQWSEIKRSRLRFLQKPYVVTDLLKSIEETIQKEVS